MSGRRFWTSLSVGLASIGLASGLGGCTQTVGLYHDVEGGAISKTRQPPPGMDQPYPNLADVPAAQKPATATQQAAITAQAHSGVSAPAPGALEGLTLPAGAPALPDVPGLNIPSLPSSPVAAAPAPAPAAPLPPPVPPVSIGFVPGKALLPWSETAKLRQLAAARGHGPAQATIIAGGFGEGDLTLALARAQRLADALTADGVPSSAIKLCAVAAGSGGFVQLVY